MAKYKPQILTRDELMKHIKEVVEIADYEASKNIKSPAKKGQMQRAANLWNSILHYLTENNNANNNNQQPDASAV